MLVKTPVAASLLPDSSTHAEVNEPTAAEQISQMGRLRHPAGHKLLPHDRAGGRHRADSRLAERPLRLR